MLIGELARGNEEAFRFYYAKHWDTVYHFIFRCSQSRHLAEYGSQQVFECVWWRRRSITSVHILKHIIALGCTSIALKGLKEDSLKGVDVSAQIMKKTADDQVDYTPNLKECLQNISNMAYDVNKMDEKSTEQFKAELDFIESFILEAKQLGDDRSMQK
jgi:hypothetical protein